MKSLNDPCHCFHKKAFDHLRLAAVVLKIISESAQVQLEKLRIFAGFASHVFQQVLKYIKTNSPPIWQAVYFLLKYSFKSSYYLEE